MSVDEARGTWRTAGRTMRGLLVWPRRRLLRLLQDLFEPYDQLRTAHDALCAQRDRASRWPGDPRAPQRRGERGGPGG